MKRVVIREFGNPQSMSIEDFCPHALGDNDVLIKVNACGVNFSDLVIRLGIYPGAPDLPFTPGYEVAGTIEEVGRGVMEYARGDRVFAAIESGGYATHVVCPSYQLFRTPAEMSDDEAAVITASYLTAWLAIDRLAHVRAGETVVIHSAGGGVGLAALQICLAREARPIAIASEPKHTRLQFLGAETCIDPKQDNVSARLVEITEGKGVDVVLDSTGGASYQTSFDSLAPLGRLVLLGGAGVINGAGVSPLQVAHFWHRTLDLYPVVLATSNKSISGLHLPALWARYPICVGGIVSILDLYRSGHIMPVIDSVFPLEEAASAHQYLHDRLNFGKVLLHP
jgi:NADPH:quinone reductase-like Zn-dependent oxidoreductase